MIVEMNVSVDQIDQFYAVKRKLDALNLPDKKLNIPAWKAEHDQQRITHTRENEL